ERIDDLCAVLCLGSNLRGAASARLLALRSLDRLAFGLGESLLARHALRRLLLGSLPHVVGDGLAGEHVERVHEAVLSGVADEVEHETVALSVEESCSAPDHLRVERAAL